jgi:hypothetical protein
MSTAITAMIMESTIFRDTPHIVRQKPSDVSEEHIANTFRVEEEVKEECNMKVGG